MKSPEKKISVLKGILVPVEWDDKGNIIAVALSTFNEEEYIISNYQKLEWLMGNLRQEVELTGEITTDHNKKSLFVHDYMLKSDSANNKFKQDEIHIRESNKNA